MPGNDNQLFERIMNIFQAFKSMPEEIVQLWNRDLTYEGRPGFSSMVKTKSGAFMLVGSAPVMVLPYREKMLDMVEFVKLTSSIGEIPHSQYVFSNDTISLMFIFELDKVNEDNVMAAIDDSIKIFVGASEDLHKAFDFLFMGEQPKREFPQPKLPNISLKPNEMQVIYSVMANTDAHCQKIYNGKMVKSGTYRNHH